MACNQEAASGAGKRLEGIPRGVLNYVAVSGTTELPALTSISWVSRLWK
jgi:hypothetical protein